jgi:general secretion pathway protein J
MRATAKPRANDGFALIEAIAAIALMAIVLSSLAVMTAQWLPALNRIYAHLQQSETLAIALDRAADDIAAAQFMPSEAGSKVVLFDGTGRAAVFVRRAIGPNLDRGLELVRIGDALDRAGPAVTRARITFVPGLRDVDPAAAAVVLLRRPFRLGFEFAGPDGIWRADWQNEEKLPAAVLVTIVDRSGRRVLARIVPIRVQEAPPDCEGACGAGPLTASTREPGDEPSPHEQDPSGDSQ